MQPYRSSSAILEDKRGRLPTIEKIVDYCVGRSAPKDQALNRFEQEVNGWLRDRLVAQSGADLLPGKVWKMRDRLAVVRKTGSGGRRQDSLLAGTLFAGSHVKVLSWFRALGLFVRGGKGVSALELQEELGLGSYATALSMLNSIRAMLGAVRPKLAGRVWVGDVQIGDIWPSLRGRTDGSAGCILLAVGEGAGGRQTVVALVAASSDIGGLWSLLDSKATIVDLRDVRRTVLVGDDEEGKEGTGAGSQRVSQAPSEWQNAADGLVAWLRRIHRRPPAVAGLQAYLDEYTFRLNVGGRNRERAAVKALIELAVGVRPKVEAVEPIV